MSPQTQDDEIRCPQCGSSQVAANKKGFGLGKAAAGGLLLGPVGLLGGMIGSRKVVITCLRCGHQWGPNALLRYLPPQPASQPPATASSASAASTPITWSTPSLEPGAGIECRSEPERLLEFPESELDREARFARAEREYQAQVAREEMECKARIGLQEQARLREERRVALALLVLVLGVLAWGIASWMLK